MVHTMLKVNTSEYLLIPLQRWQHCVLQCVWCHGMILHSLYWHVLLANTHLNIMFIVEHCRPAQEWIVWSNRRTSLKPGISTGLSNGSSDDTPTLNTMKPFSIYHRIIWPSLDMTLVTQPPWQFSKLLVYTRAIVETWTWKSFFVFDPHWLILGVSPGISHSSRWASYVTCMHGKIVKQALDLSSSSLARW